MPRYTPLEKLPDSAVKERGGIHAGADRRFMLPEDIPDNQLSFRYARRILTDRFSGWPAFLTMVTACVAPRRSIR